MTDWFVLVESNTTGSGRLFAESARRLGLRPVLLARDPGRYPYVAADGIEGRVADTGDVAAVLAACAGLGGRVAGVTSSSEYFVATAAEVARSLGLPHPRPEAVRACRDKPAQRARLRDAGLPGPAFAAARTAAGAVDAAVAIGLPVVVKPVAGSGSIGVRLCATLGEVRAAAGAVLDMDPAALALPPQGAVLVEEYLAGPEYSVETFDERVVGVTRKHLGPEPGFVETGHDFPAPLEPSALTTIGDAAVAALRALRLGWGAAHVEIRRTTAGPRVVEVNPRLAGGMIPRIIEEALGVDLIHLQVSRAAGLPADPRPSRDRAASIRFLVAGEAGRLAEVRGVPEARGLPGVVEVGLTRRPGADLVLRRSFQDRLAYVIAAGEDTDAAAHAADDGLRAVAAVITPTPSPDAGTVPSAAGGPTAAGSAGTTARTGTGAPPDAGGPPAEASVAIVGLGSRGLGVLERIVTLAGRAGAAAGRVRVEVLDPSCAGAGVHATAQPDYLLLNTTCAQVSMFPDSCTVGADAGPAGPSLFEWVAERGLRLADDGCTVGRAGRPIRPTDFLPRRVLGEYLGWFLGRLLERAPEHVRITLHRASALDLTSEPDGSLTTTLSDGTRVHTGYAFLTTGYTPNAGVGHGPAGRQRIVPEPYPLPDRVAAVAPGEVVAMAGFGLSAMDLMSCLTVGRGGRFVTDSGGHRYLPSGQEPTLLLYSRTGLPCRARPKVVRFGPPYRPLAFTGARIDAVRAARGGPLDFDADVLPLVLTEMRVAYRRCEARRAGGAAERALAAELAGADGPAGLAAVLDRLDARLGPFDARTAFDGSDGMLLDGGEAYQKWLADVLRGDLAEGLLGFAGSPVKAALDVLRELRDTFRYVADFGGLTDGSLDRFTRETVPALNRAVVGPQYERHSELLALMAAGIAAAPFGPAPVTTWSERTGRWTVASTRLAEPYARDVDWIVAAYVEPPAAASSASPLLSALHRRGQIRPHRPASRVVHGIDVDPDQHPLDADGRPDRRLWVLGPLCEGATFYNNLVPSPGTWSRPVFDAHRCVAALLDGGSATPAPPARRELRTPPPP